jgi:hypothetical protein
MACDSMNNITITTSEELHKLLEAAISEAAP